MKLLKILYNLLLTDATPVKTLISDKINTVSTSIIADDQTIDEYVDVENELEESKDGKVDTEVFLGYMDNQSMIGSRFGNTEGKGGERPDISKVQSQSASDMAARRATRRGSIDMNEVQKK